MPAPRKIRKEHRKRKARFLRSPLNGGFTEENTMKEISENICTGCGWPAEGTGTLCDECRRPDWMPDMDIHHVEHIGEDQ